MSRRYTVWADGQIYTDDVASLPLALSNAYEAAQASPDLAADVWCGSTYVATVDVDASGLESERIENIPEGASHEET